MSTEPLDRADQLDRNHTLLEELAWSVALIGGVAVLVLVVQFAA
jgi:hypothetical protein